MKKLSYLLALLSVLLIAGCSSSDQTVSKQEEQDFKGKPIPPEVLEKMRNQRPPNMGGQNAPGN